MAINTGRTGYTYTAGKTPFSVMLKRAIDQSTNPSDKHTIKFAKENNWRILIYAVVNSELITCLLEKN